MIKHVTGYIRITSTPTGDAPLSARQAWVGLVLPVLAVGEVETLGLLKPGSVSLKNVYQVRQSEAIQILAESCPTVAEWFRKKGFGKETSCFAFLVEEAEVVGTLEDRPVRHFLGLEEVGVGSHDHPANIRN